MGDQTALGVGGVRIAGLADFHLGQDLPDQLQIHIGDDDPGIAARAGHGHDHVRFRIAAEINRAEVGLARCRLDERRLGRAIGTATDDVQGQARHPDLLVTVGIDLDHVGDRRDLAQQAQGVEAPLLEVAGRRGQVGHPAELIDDAAEKSIDAAGGPVRLGPQPVLDHRSLVAIAEPCLADAIGEQRHQHRDIQSQEIFAEQ